MLKIVLAAGSLATIAYIALPQYQAAIASIAPLLLALACPLAMLLMAAGMNSSKEPADGGKSEGARVMPDARSESASKGARHA